MEEVKKENKYESLSYDELSQISRDDHQEDVRQYDKQQNALCLVVIGAITLICVALFISHSCIMYTFYSVIMQETVYPFLYERKLEFQIFSLSKKKKRYALSESWKGSNSIFSYKGRRFHIPMRC